MEQFIEFIGNHYILSIIWVVLFFSVLFSWIKGKFSQISAVSTQQLTLLVNKEDGVVVDIRSADEFKKGHIAGAKHVPLTKIQQNELAKLENHKSNPIIVVCNAGMSAAGAANTLFKTGFTNVHLLQGGMNAWINAGLPVAKKK
ncbi:rhodanese-like domain-containing protein [Flocculibacter collagenilyticus]|uniref:rhodanese-like domain-containing protein n=1 Tax=Flocculibacter collagenilyticus TaxID=2744479 RepID=UPI0018F28444|nr:rhodanese-like domain-containing protein [Flocculibacter collagenilyticus]